MSASAQTAGPRPAPSPQVPPTPAASVSFACPRGESCVDAFATIGKGTRSSPWAGWEPAVAALPPNSAIHFRAGYYILLGTLEVKPGWHIYGDGQQATWITTAISGDAFRATAAINLSSAAHNYIHDLGIACTNPANAGGGYVDVAGTYLQMQRVYVGNFKYGVILDQSEIVTLAQCQFEANTTAGVWLTNGPEHSQETIPSGHGGGEQTITPESMALVQQLWKAAEASKSTPWLETTNADGTNRERVRVTSVGPQSFTAIFASPKRAGWRIGAMPGFTNRITVTGCQFNHRPNQGYGIVDDGGAAHTFSDNNFAGGMYGLRLSGVSVALVIGNELEAQSAAGIALRADTLAGTFVGAPISFTIMSNSFSEYSGANYCIDIHAALSGTIQGNSFTMPKRMHLIGFTGGGNAPAAQIRIAGNYKNVVGQYKSDSPFLAGFTTTLNQNIIEQKAVTYSARGTAAGAVEITPATMEFIAVGSRLFCTNPDYTNGETVTVTATTANTFRASFTLAKADDFLILGVQ